MAKATLKHRKLQLMLLMLNAFKINTCKQTNNQLPVTLSMIEKGLSTLF